MTPSQPAEKALCPICGEGHLKFVAVSRRCDKCGFSGAFGQDEIRYTAEDLQKAREEGMKAAIKLRDRIIADEVQAAREEVVKLDATWVNGMRTNLRDNKWKKDHEKIGQLCDLALIALDSQGSGWISVEAGLPDMDTVSDEPSWYQCSDYYHVLPLRQGPFKHHWENSEIEVAYFETQCDEENNGEIQYAWVKPDGDEIKVAYFKEIGPLPSPPKEPK